MNASYSMTGFFTVGPFMYPILFAFAFVFAVGIATVIEHCIKIKSEKKP